MRSLSTLLVLTLCATTVLSAAVVPKTPEQVRALVKDKWNKMMAKKSEFPALPVGGTQDKNAFNFAIDVISSVSQSTFNCIYSYGYSLAFLRIYGPSNNGQVDSTGVNNVYYATNAGLAYEVFITPSTSNVKSGGTQFTEAYNYASSQGLKLSRVWLQVTSPVNWGTNTYTNVNFISNFISTANSYGIQVGVYTNWYDWSQITGSTSTVSPSALWYWAANGVGSQAESTRDASDFYSFGPFRSAMIKQFGIAETICQTSVNVNLYSSSADVKPNTVDMSARKFQKEH